MAYYRLEDRVPHFDDPASVWTAPNASIIGSVSLGRNVGIWFGACLRGDIEPISIGDGTSIQDLAMVCTVAGFPVVVGRRCTIEPRAMLRGCRIEDATLIGLGAIVLHGAVIGSDCIVSAGAVVPEGMTIPAGSLVAGAPAEIVRDLDAMEKDRLARLTSENAKTARRFASGLSPYDPPSFSDLLQMA